MLETQWLDTGEYDNLTACDPQTLTQSPKGFAVIDLETTGLNESTHRIIEVGIVFLDENLKPTHAMETLINPQRQMEAQWIHKISASSVVKAPTFRQIARSLYAALNGRVVVAHNVRFERKFLNAAFNGVGIEKIRFLDNMLDTMVVAPKVISAPNAKLATLTELAGIQINNAHAALPDAVGTAKLLQMVGHAVDVTAYTEDAANRAYSMHKHEQLFTDELKLWRGRNLRF